MLSWLIGTVLTARALRRAGVVTWAAVVAVVVSVPLQLILADVGGGIALALVWGWLGLRSLQRKPDGRTSRSREEFAR